MSRKSPALQLAVPPSGTWVQVDRASLERWGRLTMEHPRASALLQVMIAQMGRNNAIVTSQGILAKLLGCSVRTIQRQLEILTQQNWIEVRHVGPGANGSAYVVNSRVAWSGNRDGIRYALFEATVLVADTDQPDRETIGMQPPLERIPVMAPGERQLPLGPGLDPPSQPSIPGMELDLPTKQPTD
jgi:Helix-turn-helix domain